MMYQHTEFLLPSTFHKKYMNIVQSCFMSLPFSLGQEKKCRVSTNPTDPILWPRPYRFYWQICLYRAERTI